MVIIKLLGLGSLMKKVDAMSEGVERALRSAVFEGCTIVHESATRIVPVRTGNLKGSLSVDVQSQPGAALGRVGTNVEYAPYVEFGTDRMDARPYLRPALDENQERIRKKMQEAIKRELRAS